MRHFNEILALFFHDSNSLEPKIHRLKHFFNFGEEVQGFEDISQQFFKLQKSYNDSVELLTLLVLSQFYAFNEIVCTKKYIEGHFYCSFQKSR